MVQWIKSLLSRTSLTHREDELSSELDHQRILETCNDVRLLLIRRMIDNACTLKERELAERMLAHAERGRVFIPVTIARRALYGTDSL